MEFTNECYDDFWEADTNTDTSSGSTDELYFPFLADTDDTEEVNEP